jgi:hypothetical protein
MFTKVFLAGVRREALRKRVWYKALDSLERGEHREGRNFLRYFSNILFLMRAISRRTHAAIRDV